MIANDNKEWCELGGSMNSVVVHELSKGQEVWPVILLVTDEATKVLLQSLDATLGLAVSLQMVS